MMQHAFQYPDARNCLLKKIQNQKNRKQHANQQSSHNLSAVVHMSRNVKTERKNRNVTHLNGSKCGHNGWTTETM